MSLWVLLVGAAPAMALMAFFYWRDRYEREPLPHVLAAFILGAYALLAAQGAAGLVERFVTREWLALGGTPARLFDAFVVAGLVEECAKLIVLAGAVYHWSQFDEPLDGLIYGVAVSLGFAGVENVFYLARLGLGVAWLRAVFAVPAHALMGAIMGFYLGRAKFEKGGLQARHFLYALGLPTLFHGAYDFALARRLQSLVWITISVLSALFWRFVLVRVYRAQRASPFRPRTIAPFSRPTEKHPHR
ncbi:MAG: PrsW family glutamic-type intramembrane protease [Deltaproteobacteria bacterium]|nr:PrsW family glutamic-type intramembrane protease [Deltaproteobacteria bacterium]